MKSTLHSVDPGAAAAFVPENAAIAALSLLAIGGFVLAALTAGLILRRLRRPEPARWAFRASAATALLYATVLGITAAASRDRVLPPGSAKYFCEIDCHLALSLVDVERRAAAGPLPARGEFLIVRLRTWFDPRTIAAFRGKGPLWPHPRRVRLEDARGRRFARSPAAEAALDADTSSFPLTTPVVPGESFDTRLVFEVPSGATGLRLLVAATDLSSRLLVGHEQSPGHGKVYFRVP